MGNKRHSNQKGIPKATGSFAEFLSEKQLQKLKPWIDRRVSESTSMAIRYLAQKQADAMQQLFLQLSVVETILMEKFEDITSDYLSARYAEVEDKAEGYRPSDEPSKQGDRLRIEMQVKKLADGEAAEFSEPSRHLIENVGSGATFGNEIESKLLGLNVGDSAEIEILGKTEDKSKDVVVRAKIERISEPIAPPTPPATEAKPEFVGEVPPTPEAA